MAAVDDPEATMAHRPLLELPGLSLPEVAPWWAEWLEHDRRDAYWEDIELSRDYDDFEVPILHVGGWFDLFSLGTVRNFVGLQQAGKAPQRMWMGPWSHGSYERYHGEVDFGATGPLLFSGLPEAYEAFFDQHLRGAPAPERDPAVRYFVIGANAWRDAEAWPPPEASELRLHLHSGGAANSARGDGALADEAPGGDEPADRYVYDPLRPVPTEGGCLLQLPIGQPGPRDQREVEARDDVLCYTSEPLTEPLTVAGPVSVELWAVTDAHDTDWTAKLVDVYPDGRALGLCDGIRRASFRDSLSDPAPVSPGEPAYYAIELSSVAYRFAPGHRVRLEVSSSNYPRFRRQPQHRARRAGRRSRRGRRCSRCCTTARTPRRCGSGSRPSSARDAQQGHATMREARAAVSGARETEQARMVATDKPYKVIGTRPVRPDGTDKVTGRAEYGADVRFPRMAYGRVKRSPYAHANLKRIDASKAEALPGVLAVVTAQDLPDPGERVVPTIRGLTPLKWIRGLMLARDKVVFRGHPVAAVCATDAHIAEDALDLIEIEYEELPPVLDVQEAMSDAAPILHEGMRTEELLTPVMGAAGEQRDDRPSNIAKHLELSIGDVEAGFAEADVIVEGEFGTTMAHQGYIEPHASTAQWQPDGELIIWTTTQGAFAVRDLTAQMLELPVSRIKVIPTEIGGGFGGKTKLYLEPIAAILSRKVGRPVQVVMTRTEVMEASGPTSGTHLRAKIGAKRDGTIVALEGHFAYEAGAYPGSPYAAGARCAFGPYDVPNQYVEAWDVVLNKPAVAAYRAPGAPASEFAVESLIDELAERLEMDPIELRLKNAATEARAASTAPPSA